ncbi:hypothetical protein MNEG_8802 [Monoraphidium neglectum]|uniref:Uncharacterized protein n=1 Tax=Monoraphidium neglectum TaxID=145388 RepID=A0A0D2M737_9CHLO|nr:hypothetical protein MNEG_8802 [Monoraphidium neglectum]KIY99159.1 hypothetical protein MNEG_8802 [Monoraphidium neglectum]|eukprot:XP_013898179.1 hypothetical protein MNEG_8802 [Monoraphidium neglectum]
MSTPFATNDPQAGEQGPTKEVTFAESAGQVEQQQNSGIKREQSGFNLVASPSGANLFVEAAKEYDPLEHHRPRNKEANKGEGLGFMFSCFTCCGAPAVKESAATAERHYSLPPSASAADLGNKTQ